MEDKNLYFIYFFIIFMLLGIAIISIVYYNEQSSTCRMNPLVFGAKQYLENSDAKMIIGRVTLIGDIGTAPLEIYFNENNKTVGHNPTEKNNFVIID